MCKGEMYTNCKVSCVGNNYLLVEVAVLKEFSFYLFGDHNSITFVKFRWTFLCFFLFKWLNI